MEKIIVLELQGKHESTDFATVRLFDSETEAEKFCAEKNTGRQKYWTVAQIVMEGEKVELGQPE